MPRPPLLTTAIGLCLTLVTSALVPSAVAAEERLHILVTNDDGYDSPALAALVTELSAIADIAVSAPDGNRSGSSHSISLAAALEVREVEIAGATRAVAVSGTPAAAASYGILVLGRERPFDLVVSGINRGANIGILSHYSGTVGAAMEGAYHGLPAIAVSQDGASSDYRPAAVLTRRIIQTLPPAELPAGLVLNVNVPRAAIEAAADGAEAPLVVLPMGGSSFDTRGWERIQEEGKTSIWRADLRPTEAAPTGSDTEAFLAGKVTIAPLRFDWTDREQLPTLAERLAKLR